MTKTTKSLSCSIDGSCAPRILLLDIETVPGTAYIWSLYDSFIPLERLITPGRVVCAAFSWYGDKRSVQFVAEWHRGGQEAMLAKLHKAMSEADAIITYNGDKFDLPRLRGAFLSAGLPPPAPSASIDLYKTVKQLGYQSGKLEFVAPFLKIGAKIKHAGFRLWRAIMDGEAWARKDMETYNRQDTSLLAGLYNKLRPYIKTHPYLHAGGAHVCPACGGRHIQHRGYRRTKAFRIERLQCQTCGTWSDGARRKAK